MAFSVVGTAQSAAGTGPTLSVNNSAGVTTNDIVLLFVMTETPTAAATASGFTQIGDQAASTQSMRTTALYKVAGASEPGTYSATASTGSSWIEIGLIVIRGANSSTPVDVSAGNSNGGATSTSVTGSSLTTTAIDELIWFAADWNGNESMTFPTGYTSQLNDSGNGLFIATKTQSASGSTGTATGTLNASDTWITWHIALKPAGGGGGTAWNQSLTDAQSALDTRLSQAQKRPSEFLSALDTLVKNYTSSQSEKFSSLDAALKAAQHLLTGDGTSATDSTQRARGSVWTIVDALSGRDSITQHAVTKLLGETLSSLDTTRFATTHQLVETFITLDVLSKLPSHLLSDIVSSTDTFSGTKNAGAVAWSKTLLDVQSAQDVRLAAVQKPLSETQSAQDLRTALAIKAIAENLVLVDSQSWQTVHRLVEVLSVTDKLTAGKGLLLALQEWFSSTDVSTEVKQQALAQGHLAVLSLTISALLGVHLAISTSASISAVVSALSQAIHATTGLVNALQSLRTIAASLQATVTLR